MPLRFLQCVVTLQTVGLALRDELGHTRDDFVLWQVVEYLQAVEPCFFARERAHLVVNRRNAGITAWEVFFFFLCIYFFFLLIYIIIIII